MNYKIFEAKYNDKVFRIEEDYPAVGSYLYVYENGKCVKDYLQNSFSECMDFASEEFGVPLEMWVEIN
jgi:hypothetical protein